MAAHQGEAGAPSAAPAPVRARAAAAEALQAKVVDEAARAQRLGGLLHSVWPRARHRPARPMPLPWTADITEQTQPASCCGSTENCAIRSRLPHSTLASSSAAAGLAHGAALAQGCLPLRSCWVRATLIRTTAAIDTLQLSQLQLRFSKHLQCHASQRAYAMRSLAHAWSTCKQGMCAQAHRSVTSKRLPRCAPSRSASGTYSKSPSCMPRRAGFTAARRSASICHARATPRCQEQGLVLFARSPGASMLRAGCAEGTSPPDTSRSDWT